MLSSLKCRVVWTPNCQSAYLAALLLFITESKQIGDVLLQHCSVLTLAGVCVASLSRSPGQVVVKVTALLTVQPLGVMIAHTPAVNLNQESETGKGEFWREESKVLTV